MLFAKMNRRREGVPGRCWMPERSSRLRCRMTPRIPVDVSHTADEFLEQPGREGIGRCRIMTASQTERYVFAISLLFTDSNIPGRTASIDKLSRRHRHYSHRHGADRRKSWNEHPLVLMRTASQPLHMSSGSSPASSFSSWRMKTGRSGSMQCSRRSSPSASRPRSLSSALSRSFLSSFP